MNYESENKNKMKDRLEREVHSGIVQLCTNVKVGERFISALFIDLSPPTNSDIINVK